MPVNDIPDKNPDINFKLDEQLQPSKTRPIVEWLDKTGKHILIAAEAAILITLAINFYFSRSLNSLSEEYKALKDQTQSSESLKLIEDHKLLQHEVETIQNIYNTQLDWNKRLKTLQEKIPSDLIVSSYEFTASDLRISANVKSVQGFAFFISRLKSDKDIKSVVMTKSNYVPDDKSFDFEMEITL